MLPLSDVVLTPITIPASPQTLFTKDQIENLAVLAECARLTAREHAVRIVAWPDRERQGKPLAPGQTTPDCLLDVDGEEIAVDVTEFWASPTGGRQQAEWQRLQNAVRTDIMGILAAHGAFVLCNVVFRQWPSRRVLEQLHGEFRRVVSDALPVAIATGTANPIDRRPGPHGLERAVDVSISTDFAQYFEALQLRRIYGVDHAPDMLITSVDATESSVPGPEYDRFVNDILLAKTQQLRTAAAAEVVVAARPPFDNHALAQAIKRRAGDVPGNWICVSAAIIGGPATLVWP